MRFYGRFINIAFSQSCTFRHETAVFNAKTPRRKDYFITTVAP